MARKARRTGIAVGAALAGTVATATILSTLPATSGQHAPALAADRQSDTTSTSTSPYRVPPPPPPVSSHYVVPDPPSGADTRGARSTYHERVIRYHPHRLAHPDQDDAGTQIVAHEGDATSHTTGNRALRGTHRGFERATAPTPPTPPGATATDAPAPNQLDAGPPSTLPLPSLPKLPLPGLPTSALPAPDTGDVAGLDVSNHQGAVDWGKVAADGGRFAYVKATEGTTYTNPHFADQYTGSFGAGLTRGAYHFALPDVSSGTAQADYFIAHGGGWSPDGKTLPPALDMEYNPYGADCYGLNGQQMTDWVRGFSEEVRARTGRYPMIYTSTSWWNKCTGGSTAFGQTNPLWVPRYGSSVGTLPAGWDFQTIWQFADSGTFPGDQNTFNGAASQLDLLARG